MTDVGVIVLIRMPRGALVALRDEDDDSAVAVFASEADAEKMMEGHILNPLPRQIVEVEI